MRSRQSRSSVTVIRLPFAGVPLDAGPASAASGVSEVGQGMVGLFVSIGAKCGEPEDASGAELLLNLYYSGLGRIGKPRVREVTCALPFLSRRMRRS